MCLISMTMRTTSTGTSSSISGRNASETTNPTTAASTHHFKEGAGLATYFWVTGYPLAPRSSYLPRLAPPLALLWPPAEVLHV